MEIGFGKWLNASGREIIGGSVTFQPGNQCWKNRGKPSKDGAKVRPEAEGVSEDLAAIWHVIDNPKKLDSKPLHRHWRRIWEKSPIRFEAKREKLEAQWWKSKGPVQADPASQVGDDGTERCLELYRELLKGIK